MHSFPRLQSVGMFGVSETGSLLGKSGSPIEEYMTAVSTHTRAENSDALIRLSSPVNTLISNLMTSPTLRNGKISQHPFLILFSNINNSIRMFVNGPM